MSDMNDDLDQESGETEAAAEESPVDDKGLHKLKKENQNLRQRLRRSELEATFGKDVVELIPEELPLAKWEEFAGKVAERMPKQATEQTETAPPAQAQEPEPVGFGTVVNAPPSGTQASEPLVTARQLHELFKTDPARATQMMNAGQFQKEGRPDGTKGWVVDPSV